MANYHVNLKTGKTGVCKADPGKCPVQATDGAAHLIKMTLKVEQKRC